jgi:hypothetical protein
MSPLSASPRRGGFMILSAEQRKHPASAALTTSFGCEREAPLPLAIDWL